MGHPSILHFLLNEAAVSEKAQGKEEGLALLKACCLPWLSRPPYRWLCCSAPYS
jgi:hypothetical protein